MSASAPIVKPAFRPSLRIATFVATLAVAAVETVSDVALAIAETTNS